MAALKYIACALMAFLAIVRWWRDGRRLAGPWPWAALAAFGWWLLLTSALPLARPDRLIAFGGLVAVLVVGYRWRWGWLVAVLVALVIWLDVFRVIPTADVVITPGETTEYFRRPYFLQNPNVMAGVLLLLAALTNFPTFIICTAALTQSRGALVGIAAAYTVVIVELVKNKMSEWDIPRRLRFATWIWLVAGISASLLFALWLRPVTAFARFDFWREGLTLAAARPLTGWGPGAMYTSLHEQSPEAAQIAALLPTRTEMAHAHNMVITVAAETGFVGAALLLVCLVLCGRVVWQSKSNLPRLMLMAFFVQQMVDDNWLFPVTALLIGFVLVECVDETKKDIQTKAAQALTDGGGGGTIQV